MCAPQEIAPSGIDAGAAGSARLWLAQNFAEAWYRDTCREAEDTSGVSKRREIIFAVACAESYLLEVTRQVVGAEHVDCYLPPMDRRGIRERWKETAKQLVRNGKLPKLPCFDGRAWSHFVATVQLRDALLHARTARPYVPNEAPRDDIEVTLADLERQKPGEARDAVKSLISAFAQSGKIDAPCWLVSA